MAKIPFTKSCKGCFSAAVRRQLPETLPFADQSKGVFTTLRIFEIASSIYIIIQRFRIFATFPEQRY